MALRVYVVEVKVTDAFYGCISFAMLERRRSYFRERGHATLVEDAEGHMPKRAATIARENILVLINILPGGVTQI
ncbi:hypothetical protein VP1G_10980 [Cytospora mali]|uniref:Uncharacterized protein n=1 Tax=Cytospora mali TaxID=578113 RepID=A0A194V1K4_CYTMA|nr:hypothetical protein VP1G_10980 [Valsa mali var. pyri (nom. inval.)]